MPWLNPQTGRFEAGNGPVDRRRPGTHADFSDAAWRNLNGGAELDRVESVDAVLEAGQTHKDEGVGGKDYSEKKADDVPKG